MRCRGCGDSFRAHDLEDGLCLECQEQQGKEHSEFDKVEVILAARNTPTPFEDPT